MDGGEVVLFDCDVFNQVDVPVFGKLGEACVSEGFLHVFFSLVFSGVIVEDKSGFDKCAKSPLYWIITVQGGYLCK